MILSGDCIDIAKTLWVLQILQKILQIKERKRNTTTVIFIIISVISALVIFYFFYRRGKEFNSERKQICVL